MKPTTTEPIKGQEIEKSFSSLPEFGRWQDVQRLFGIKRGTLYNLIVEGKVKSVCMRRKGNIREHIPLKADYSKRRPDYKGLLKKEYEDAGFELIKLWQYGRTYVVSFGWVFPQDRSNPRSRLCLYACAFECTPTPDRTLGKGRWLMPSDEIVGCLFARQFKKMSPKNPVDMLTDQGKEIALETFKWTKVSLLSPKELKRERIEFIHQHSDLCLNRLELAKAMIKAGLYSDTLQHSAIYKQLPGLIKTAKKKEP